MKASALSKIVIFITLPVTVVIFIALYVSANFAVFAQADILKPGAKRDSVWLNSLLKEANRSSSAKNSNTVAPIWLKGKVIYCSDGSLKATQLIATPDTFATLVQYKYHGKIITQRFTHTDLLNYSIDKICRLPDKIPAYLFLLSTVEYQPDHQQDWLKNFDSVNHQTGKPDFINIKTITHVALVLRLEKDSLVEKSFPPITAEGDDDPIVNNANATDTFLATKTIAVDTNSIAFTSNIKHSGKTLNPFLRYDTLTGTLGYLRVYHKHEEENDSSEQPVLDVDSGAYLYKDTAFVLAKDTSYYYPSLNELDTIVARRNFRAGKYLVKATATTGYEAEYGGYLHQTMTKKYSIGKQVLTEFNNEEWDSNLNPEFRVQKNASLILLLQDDTNDYRPGACGSGSHFDSQFWLADGNSTKQLFSFSTSTCTSRVSYTFTKKGTEISGNLYFKARADNEEFGTSLDRSYWLNNTTYVFVINSDKAPLARNFYLHFNVADKKQTVRLKAGKIYKVKRHL